METAQAFTFDRVFHPTEGQEAVFEEVARPIVDGPYHYGQSGAVSLSLSAIEIDARHRITSDDDPPSHPDVLQGYNGTIFAYGQVSQSVTALRFLCP